MDIGICVVDFNTLAIAVKIPVPTMSKQPITALADPAIFGNTLNKNDMQFGNINEILKNKMNVGTVSI